MNEELATTKLTGLFPPPDSAVAAYFKHIEECGECREHHSLELCTRGEALLDQAANVPLLD